MKATGTRFAAAFFVGVTLLLATLAGLAFAGISNRESSVGLGVLFLLLAAVVALASTLFADIGGACDVSSDNGDVSFVVNHVYETVSCTLVDKDRYVAVVKDTDGNHWACYVKKALPPVFVVRAGEERYVPFGSDFGKAAVPTEPQTS